MLIELLYKLGVFNILHKLNPRHLTVLNYHRISDHHAPDFETFKPNVSATPGEFARQMDYLQRHFNIVSIHEMHAWLEGKADLPKYPALITFDDGYYDNLSNALPVLTKRGIPALVFVTTDYINRNKAPFWDMVAFCFYRSKRKMGQLPLLGEREWGTRNSCDALIREFSEAIKYLPAPEKKETLERLQEILEVKIGKGEFSNLFLNWDQVRELRAAGIDIGAHTITHPILTLIPIDAADTEISDSKTMIENQLGERVSSFAYPNGQATDFNDEISGLVRKAGYKSAFSLIDGPSSFKQVKGAPYQIRRIFIGHKDNLQRFAAKVTGIQRIVTAIRG